MKSVSHMLCNIIMGDYPHALCNPVLTINCQQLVDIMRSKLDIYNRYVSLIFTLHVD